MPSVNIEPGIMPWQKRVADLCTAARGPLALLLIWLGISRGKDGIQIAFLLLLAAATLDTMDGYFARISNSPHQTWIGEHDLVFDMGFSLALLLYLSLAGYLSPILAALYTGFWVVVFSNQPMLSNTLAVLSQAPVYAGTVLAAVVASAQAIVLIAVWVSVMLLFAGKRFFNIRLPAFFEDFARRFLPSQPEVPIPERERSEAKK